MAYENNYSYFLVFHTSDLLRDVRGGSPRDKLPVCGQLNIKVIMRRTILVYETRLKDS